MGFWLQGEGAPASPDSDDSDQGDEERSKKGEGEGDTPREELSPLPFESLWLNPRSRDA